MYHVFKYCSGRDIPDSMPDPVLKEDPTRRWILHDWWQLVMLHLICFCPEHSADPRIVSAVVIYRAFTAVFDHE